MKRSTRFSVALVGLGLAWAASCSRKAQTSPHIDLASAHHAEVASGEEDASSWRNLARPQAEAQARVAPTEAPVRTFVREPELERKAQRAKELSEAAILSEAKRKELRALYADEALIARQRDRLQRTDPAADRAPPRDDRVASYTFAYVNGSLPAEGEAERMDAVRYMSEALRWKDNPAREVLVEEIERVLLEDSIDERLHAGIRRGMLGDRIELFSIYAREFPSQTDALIARASSVRVEKILRLARESHDVGYTYDGVGRPRGEVASRNHR